MLRVTTAERLEDLATSLADVLRVPMADPMAAEWIIVPSAGAQRWLSLQLARHLGTSGPGATDGIAANLELLFPGRLTRQVLTPAAGRGADPWGLERVAWVTLDVLDGRHEPNLGPLTTLAPGATRWGRARRLADLYDRYLLHRPEMLLRWHAGDDVDGVGNRLPDRARWQPYLWRLIRARIDEPSPAERRAAQLDDLRAGACPAEVPERICLFGLGTIPGGTPFLEFLDALGTQRDIHLCVNEPSAALTAGVRVVMAGATGPVVQRADDPTIEVACHPLLRSWARPAREAVVLLGDRIDEAATTPAVAAATPTTLLAKVQADLRADRPPAADFTPTPNDHSIRIHICHGATRQVEVLRDQLLHLLADDPTLTEDDIVVLCPSLEEFVPLIESIFGPSVGLGLGDAPEGGAPALAYRITDRSLRSTSTLLGALGALVELLASRFSDAAVLDFADLGPVRERYGLTDGDLITLATWVETANTRWGLDGAHRSSWGIPASHHGGSWQTAADRLLVGIATSDLPTTLAPSDLAPIAVEGDGVALAGRLADLLGRLSRLEQQARTPRPVRDWVTLLQQASAALFAVEPKMAWQEQRLTSVLEQLVLDATIDDVPNPVDLTLGDVRHVLGRSLQSTAGRSDFFRGGITFCSLTPLRGLPYRVIALLGMDETAFAAGAPDGDDLTAAHPRLGDRDRRSDTRQALLETILAAQDHLVLTRSGRSVVTNQPVPAAVVVAELRDVLTATVTTAHRRELMAGVEIVQPRQSFDERNFTATAPTDPAGLEAPWSFDPVAAAGAAARSRQAPSPPFLAVPLDRRPPPLIDLADLRDFLDHPPKYFLERILELRLPRNPTRTSGALVAPTPGSNGVPRAADGRDLVLDLDGLEAWDIRNRLLEHRRAGRDLDSFVRQELAADVLPPGRLAPKAVADAVAKVDPLLSALESLGATPPPSHQPIDITLPDGTRVVGAVRDDRGERPGPISVSVSGPRDKQQLGPWLDLLALTATDPTPAWRAVLLNPIDTKRGYQQRTLEIPQPDPSARHARAVEALTVVVDLFRRGHGEPLPLFPELSPALHAGRSTGSAWSPFVGQGDGDDESIQMAFDHPTLGALLDLPLRPDDPPGDGDDRARRYANVLWGAIDSSTAPPPEDGP